MSIDDLERMFADEYDDGLSWPWWMNLTLWSGVVAFAVLSWTLLIVAVVAVVR